MKEILIGTTSSGISYQLRDILHMQVLASAPLHYKGGLASNIVLRMSLPLEGSSSLIHDILRHIFCFLFLFLFLLYKVVDIKESTAL
jgi:hypothetical protein